MIAIGRGLIAEVREGEAHAHAGNCLRQHAGSADAMGLAGDAAFAAGDPRGALRHYRASAAVRGPWPLVKRMAFAHEAAQDVRGAEALLAVHLAGEPNNAEAAAMIARRFSARGEETRAALLRAHARRHGG